MLSASSRIAQVQVAVDPAVIAGLNWKRRMHSCATVFATISRPENGAPRLMTSIQPDMALSDNDWLVSSRATLARSRFVAKAESVGRVEHVSDGIASSPACPMCA